MSQLSFFGLEPPVWSVGELTRHVRELLETDYHLQDLWVAGEVSNLSQPSSGHLYFTLKDAQASLRCVMWRPDVARIRHLPREGEALEVHGRIGVYETGGQYQLYADTIRIAGEGELYQEFLRIKARLEAEGLFDPEQKRPLPAWPHRIGVVTSPTGAALRDVVRVLRRRYPLVEVIVAPTPVQGEQAPPGIIAGIQNLNRYSCPDVILVVRGGGSAEDLWAFNDEGVVRAIAASESPVVSGVGHETDFILTDFAADVRSPTPSAAAEIATPDRDELAIDIQQTLAALRRAYERRLREFRQMVDEQLSALRLASPQSRLAASQQSLQDLIRRACAAFQHQLALRRTAITGLAQTLRAIGPAAVLARGFSIVTRLEDGRVVRSVEQVVMDDALRIRVEDGGFGARVTRLGGENDG